MTSDEILNKAAEMGAVLVFKDGSNGPGGYGFFVWCEIRVGGLPRLFKKYYNSTSSIVDCMSVVVDEAYQVFKAQE